MQNYSSSPKIAVHIHLFYSDLWPELQQCLNSMATYSPDVFITLPVENEFLIEQIKLTCPTVNIITTENRGYDIGPFVYVLNSLNLDDYDFIVKLHTKRSMSYSAALNYFSIEGAKWREYLIEFCKTPQNFKKTLEALMSNPQIGMIGGGKAIQSHKKTESEDITERATSILNNRGLVVDKTIFVAGTMFIVRSNLLKILQNAANIKDFTPSSQSGRTHELAHVYERILGYIIYAQGYIIEDFRLRYQLYENTYKLRKIWEFIRTSVYSDRINSSHQRRIKIFGIRIYKKETPNPKK